MTTRTATRWMAGIAFLSGLLALALSFIVFAQSSQTPRPQRPLQGGISQQQGPPLQGGVSQTGQQQPTTTDTYNSQSTDYTCDAALCFAHLMDDTQKAIEGAMSTSDPEWQKAESCERNPVVWRNTDPSACWQYLTKARQLAEQNDSVKSDDLQKQAQAALDQAHQCFDPIYRHWGELGGSYNDPGWNCGKGTPAPIPMPHPKESQSIYKNSGRCKPPSQQWLNGYSGWNAWKYRVSNAVAQHYYGSTGGAKKGLHGLLGGGNGRNAEIVFDIDENGKISDASTARTPSVQGLDRDRLQSAVNQLGPDEVLPFPARTTLVNLAILRDGGGCFTPGAHKQYVDHGQPTPGPTRSNPQPDVVSRPNSRNLAPRIRVSCAKKSPNSRLLLNAQQTAQAIFDQYETYPNNPIGIYRVNNPEMPQCTFLILLSGTQFNWHQANNFITDITSSPGFLNEYFVDIEDVLYQFIPTGATLIIAGHSLGGMEAQNIAANESIRRIYHVDRVITFGSPQTVKDAPGTSYARFATRPDPVPLLALETFNSAPHFNWIENPDETKQALEGVIAGGLLGAHMSYKYLAGLVYFDALGNPNVGAGQSGRTELQLGEGKHLAAPGFLLP
jgi:hypothetical protein